MNNSFIKLTLFNTLVTDKDIYLSVNKIVSIEKKPNFTLIRLLGNLIEEVEESPEDVIDKINKL